MFRTTKAFSGFSVNDMGAAKAFYGETLGLDVSEIGMGLLSLNIAAAVRSSCIRRTTIRQPHLRF